MKYNKRIKKFILGVVLIGQSKRSYQLNINTYGKIVNNNENAIDCFRNPSKDVCAVVESYMLNLKPEINDELNTEYALNIIEAVRAASWNIDILDFQNGDITSSIFTANPPPSIKEIKLSNNKQLKQSVSIPDNFIRYLNVCPFQSSDEIVISKCSPKLNKLCASHIKCEYVQKHGSKNPANNDDYINIDNPIIQNGKIDSHEPDIDDKENITKNDTKTLIETFLFGLLTSVGILVFLLIMLCLIQSYSKKNIMNFKKISEYYENKPLVNNSGKTNSSSVNENTSQSAHSNYVQSAHSNYAQSAHSNYTYSNVSQISYSNPKHKRYLYVFDDGSVMMSKNRNQNNQNNQNNPFLQSNSNSSVVSSQNYNNSLNGQTTLSKSFNNNSSVAPIRNPQLSISTAMATAQSPFIDSSIIDSPLKEVNGSTVSIQIPPQTHENNFRPVVNQLDQLVTLPQYYNK